MIVKVNTAANGQGQTKGVRVCRDSESGHQPMQLCYRMSDMHSTMRLAIALHNSTKFVKIYFSANVLADPNESQL